MKKMKKPLQLELKVYERAYQTSNIIYESKTGSNSMQNYMI